MRVTRAFLLGLGNASAEQPDGRRCVHVVSRTAGQLILFGDSERETFHKILFKQLKFSGLRVLAWCFMGNHFHLLLEIPDREVALAALSDDEVLGRLAVLRDERSTKFLLGEIEVFRQNGNAAGLARLAERVRARLFDLSAFMKELKLKMTLAYNYAHGRSGALWDGRFKSLLVEGGEALRAVAAYIDLNPIRAGLVKRPEDYRWCSYAAAMGGLRMARAGLVSAIAYDKQLPWAKAAESYRKLLYGIGHKVRGGTSPDGTTQSKGGFTQREIEAVWAAGGKLSLAAALRCRVRYFTDGVVLGSQGFVDRFFERQRGEFGRRRTDGGRKMKGANWEGLRVLRDLRVAPLAPPDSG